MSSLFLAIALSFCTVLRLLLLLPTCDVGFVRKSRWKEIALWSFLLFIQLQYKEKMLN